MRCADRQPITQAANEQRCRLEYLGCNADNGQSPSLDTSASELAVVWSIQELAVYKQVPARHVLFTSAMLKH